MTEPQENLPTTVTLTGMLEKVHKTVYTVLPGTTTTVCQLVMKSGYVVIGTSACVDPKNFNQATGERIAYENAINALWPLEGYLLAESRFINL